MTVLISVRQWEVVMVIVRCKESWGGVTVIRKCASHEEGVKCIRKVCQIVEKCDGHRGVVKVLRESVTVIREVGKVSKKVCQCIEGSYDCYRGSVSLRKYISTSPSFNKVLPKIQESMQIQEIL